MRQDIERYCVGELQRMADAHRRTAIALFDLAARATQPLLAATLREQVAVNTWSLEQLERAFAALGQPLTEQPNAEVAVMVLEATSEEDETDPAVRDMMIAQAAIRLEHYALANYAGLMRWMHQLGHHETATRIDEVMKRIRMAELHLEALQPSLSGLFVDPPRRYETPAVARPRDRQPRSDLDGYEP